MNSLQLVDGAMLGVTTIVRLWLSPAIPGCHSFPGHGLRGWNDTRTHVLFVCVFEALCVANLCL